MNSTNGTYEEIGEDTATIWLPLYDPDFPVDRTNQIAQLASICVINSLTREYCVPDVCRLLTHS